MTEGFLKFEGSSFKKNQSEELTGKKRPTYITIKSFIPKEEKRKKKQKIHLKKPWPEVSHICWEKKSLQIREAQPT